MNPIVETPNIINLPGSDNALSPVKTDWLTHLARATCPAGGLKHLTLPVREPIVGEWFRQGDLGFIYGPRGLGKTWLAMLLARRCAEGGVMADWSILKPRRVLYVDGEMPLDAICERDAALTSAPAEGIFYLQHEALFHATGQVLNLANSIVQAALLERCQADGIEILFLDNLSCLFTGVSENDADAWEKVLPWLLDLRRSRIAVVFVAHAGRNGLMRGTSRREDSAFWILNLTAAEDAATVQAGARFEKQRNAPERDCPPLEWQFVKAEGEVRARVSWKKTSAATMFRQCIEDGLTGASDIAEEMGITKGQVSKLAKRAMAEGWLTKAADGRHYALVG